MVEVLPFPLAQRRSYVRRQADWYVEQGHRAGENNLFRQMQLQRDTLLRKGVDPTRVELEVRAVEEAIRAEVRRLTFAPGGVRR